VFSHLIAVIMFDPWTFGTNFWGVYMEACN